MKVRPLERPTAAELAQLAGIFDGYRTHYGDEVQPGASEAWLADNLGLRRLSAFVAEVDGAVVGFALTLDVPASLRLGHYWQVRDLFVLPAHRRLGVGRALLEFICRVAGVAGALRVAVQTEVDNAGALRLYEAIGFARVDGYVGLSLAVPADPVDQASISPHPPAAS